MKHTLFCLIRKKEKDMTALDSNMDSMPVIISGKGIPIRTSSGVQTSIRYWTR